MKKYISFGVVVLIIICGAWFVTNSPSASTTKVITASKEKRVIKIGIMLPLTSQFGTIGEGVGKAANMAIQDYMKQHPNVTITTVQEDDKFDAKVGIAAYTKMTSLDKVDAIFMVSTPVLDAVNQKMKEDGLPVVCVGLQNYGVGNDNIFQMSADANGQIMNIAKFVDAQGNHKKLAIVHSTNAPASIGFYDAFLKTYTKEHADFLLNNKDDAKTIATKIVASKVDAVVFLTDPSNGSAITKNLLLAGMTPDKVTYYYDAQLQTGWAEYEKQVGDMNKLNKAYTLQFTTSDLTEFRSRYKAMYGTDPSPFAEYGYDGIMTLLNNYDAKNTTWVNNIAHANFKGYSGNVDFDQRGIRNQGTEVWKVEGGKVVKQ